MPSAIVRAAVSADVGGQEKRSRSMLRDGGGLTVFEQSCGEAVGECTR